MRAARGRWGQGAHAPSRRALILLVAAVAGVVALPVGAGAAPVAPPPSAVPTTSGPAGPSASQPTTATSTDPSSSTTSSSTSTSSTSTTTSTSTTSPRPSKPKRHRVPAPTTTTTDVAIPEDPTPTTVPVVGPPDITDVRLPSDSFAAAQAELDILRTRLGALVTDDAATARRLASDVPVLAAARRERDDLRASHRRHAAAVYEALSAGALADEEMRSLKPDLDSARQRKLLEAATGAEVRRTERAERRAASLDRSVTTATRRRAVLSRDITSTSDEITVVLGKLAAATSAITLVGTPAPAAAAAGPLAAAAAEAERALVAAAVARWGSPLESALAAAEYAVKRTTLAGLAAATLRPTGDAVDPAALDAVWAATSEPAMRAVLFALSQLGKPYVYATDGPATYDCSGLTRRAWAESGVGLPHFSGAQLHTGLPVAPAQLRPGDLLAYGPDGAQHVVLYVGAGTVVQAEGRAWGVVVTPVNLDPARGFAGASRPVP